MKSKITISLFFFTILITAQRPSSTEKWNATLERYEFFDSNGKITGYKKYNSYKRQWEIIDFQKNPESYRGGNNAYADGPIKRNSSEVELNTSLSASDIEYAKALGQSKALKEVREENERIKYYQSVIQNKYNELSEKIKSSSFSEYDKDELLEKFDNKVIYADETFTNLSSRTVATNKLNFIIKSYNDLLQKYNDDRINPIIGKVLQLDSKFADAIRNKVPQGFNFLTVSYDEIMESGTYSYVIREYVSARKSFGSLLNERNLTYEKANSLYSRMLVEYDKVYDK